MRHNNKNNNRNGARSKQPHLDLARITQAPNYRAQRDAQNNKYCRRCGFNRNHATHECRNIPQREKGSKQNNASNGAALACDHCGKAGHKQQDCFSNPDSTKYKGPRSQKGFESAWQPTRNRSRRTLSIDDIEMTDDEPCYESQKMRIVLEQLRREGTLTPQHVARGESLIRQKKIEEAQARFPSLFTSGSVTPAVPLNVQATQNYNPNFTFGSDAAQPYPTLDLNNCTGIGQPLGLTPRHVEILQRYMEYEAHATRSRLELDVHKKIQESQKYGLELYNQKLRLRENYFMEHQCLTRGRYDDLKGAILLKGCQVFRDPRAMQALFYRQKPCCLSCGKQGVIFDRHLTEIAASTPSHELLNLEDNMNFGDDSLKWGIFVAYRCSCVIQHGSIYVNRTAEELVGCPVDDIPQSVREQWV